MVFGGLERYPFPLAYPARAVGAACDPTDRLERAGHFIEMTAVTLGVLTLGWCRAHEVAAGAVDRWERSTGSKGITLGGWVSLLRSARDELPITSEDPLGRSIGLAIDGAQKRLEGFTPARHQFANGGRPQEQNEAAADETDHRASTLLDSIEPISGVRIAVVKDCRSVPEGGFELFLNVLAGTADVVTRAHGHSARAFAEDAVIAYTLDGLQFAVDLTPYCIYRHCPVCERDELFYLTKRKRKRSDHFAFATGHHLKLRGGQIPAPAQPLAALGMEPPPHAG